MAEYEEEEEEEEVGCWVSVQPPVGQPEEEEELWER